MNTFQHISRLPEILKKASLTVSPEYVEGFLKAKNTFLHQPVFDPVTKETRPLNPYVQGTDPASLAYTGQYLYTVYI